MIQNTELGYKKRQKFFGCDLLTKKFGFSLSLQIEFEILNTLSHEGSVWNTTTISAKKQTGVIELVIHEQSKK